MTRAFAIAAFLAITTGCGAPRATNAPATVFDSNARTTFEAARWSYVHSLRFELSVELPDVNEWKVDDHSRAEMIALNVPTRSALVIERWREPELMNRAKCEARAAERGLSPKGESSIVEDEAIEFPIGYDTRVTVAIETPRADRALRSTLGHITAYAARLRECVAFHFASPAPAEDAHGLDVLSSRLAVARARIFGHLTLDPPRVRAEATVPRESQK